MQENEKSFFGLSGLVWSIGVVEDRQDPEMLGRCKVRFFGHHTDNKLSNFGIPTEDLPWAMPALPIVSSGMSGTGQTPLGPVEGTWVLCVFQDGKNLQEPIMLFSLPGKPLALPDPSLGFSDARESLTDVPGPPESLVFNSDGSGIEVLEKSEQERYPRASHLGQPDTNRLARGDNYIQNDLSLAIPSASKFVMGAPATVGIPWNEPPSSYGALYPYNHVRETESGHVEEFDDTPGSERIHRRHRAGQFQEWRPDGSEISKVTKDRHDFVLGNENRHVDGQETITIDKGVKLLVNVDGGNDFTLEVGRAGDLNLTLDQGNLNVNVLSGDVFKFVNGNVTEVITGNYTRTIQGNHTDTILLNSTTFIGQNETNLVSLNKTLTVGQNFTRLIGQNDSQTVGAATVNLSGVSYTIFAPIVSIN